MVVGGVSAPGPESHVKAGGKNEKARSPSPTMIMLTMQNDKTVQKYQRELEEEEQVRRIAEARANVDEGDDDSPEEKLEREKARELLKDFDGDEFTAARQDDKDTLRAFFLVNGSKKMLALRSKSHNHGGGTLLHVAAFWGSLKCVRLLLQLGAQADCIDSCVSQLTPLLQAARAGHIPVCKRLILAGASLRSQDMFGDTVFHFLSRNGRGTTLQFIRTFAEKAKPGSCKGVLQIKNNKGKTCLDIAANESVANIIKRELAAEQQKQNKSVSKLRKGLAKSKIIGGQVSTAQQAKIRRTRYKKK